MGKLLVHRLGRADYGKTHELQQRAQLARQEGRISDLVLLVEHDPVITLGRGAKAQHILLSRDALAAKGVSVHETGRGGDVTYHGPGQLVVYPIIDLGPRGRDVRRYVSSLEETMIRMASDFGLSASRVQGLNGCWVGDRKIGAVGVRISRWVTMHGFAFNVTTNLDHFSLIVPCGIQDKGVTSLELETGSRVPLEEVERVAAQHLGEVLGAEIDWREGPPVISDPSPRPTSLQ